ncbi:MAG: nucleotide-binding universal stress UspA family protein [Planctomycetota bacterium]|jgi:nucleotide-binding universal stress UspA family protein
MFNSIVAAFDGSPTATRALEIAADLAARDELPLGIIYVVDLKHMQIPDEFRRMGEVEHIIDPKPKMPFTYEDLPTHIIGSMAEKAEETQHTLSQFGEFILKQAEDDAGRAGVKQLETRIMTGNPAAKILEYASARGADLIVVGSHGFGPLKRLLLGSTSQKVAQQAESSCLTVR